jgi:hypothetical protein
MDLKDIEQKIESKSIEQRNKVRVMFGLICVMALLIAALFMLLYQSFGAYTVCVRNNLALSSMINNFNNAGIIEGSVQPSATTD